MLQMVFRFPIVGRPLSVFFHMELLFPAQIATLVFTTAEPVSEPLFLLCNMLFLLRHFTENSGDHFSHFYTLFGHLFQILFLLKYKNVHLRVALEEEVRITKSSPKSPWFILWDETQKYAFHTKSDNFDLSMVLRVKSLGFIHLAPWISYQISWQSIQ